MRSVDAPTLVAGIALLLFGGVLLGDSTGAFTLSFAAYAPLVLAVVGVTLVASGLSRRD